MAELRVEVLGGLRVTTAAGREVRIQARKAQALLVCLAMRPGVPIARDYLANLLWSDTDAELARASLRQALATLRRCLTDESAGALVADASSLMLDAVLARSDLQQFRELVRDGSPHALAEAAERFDGELLPGFDARSAAFDAWLDEHRRSLRREWSQALQRAATQCRAAGDLQGAAAALTRLVAIEPTNEAAQRDLMDTFARRGLYTEALRQHRTCSEALRRDLDVGPEPATEALYRDILRRRRASTPGADDTAGVERPTPSSDAAQPPAPAPVTTLREAVVLVARIGQTPGTRGDDPEVVRDDWSRAEARVREVVGRLGGMSDRASQGEIVAVFGMHATTGNEVERALRAADQLCDAAAAGPRLAIGVARGLVLPAGGAEPFPIAGQPVAVARDLARSASLAGLVAAPDVTAHLGRRRGTTPLAGRRAELAMLETLFDRVAVAGRGRAVVIRGEPGIGKSSLLEALAGAARQRAVVYVANVLDFGQPAGERPLAALAAQLLGVAPTTDAAARHAALERALASGWLAAEDAAAAADLLALEPPGTAAARFASMAVNARERERTRVLQRLLAHVAAERPVLLIVEDAHWADASEIAQLGELAGAIATLAVLIAVSTRPEGDPFSAAWRARARGCPVTLLDLAPLADDEARELAARVGMLPDDVLERCLETAAGNPLFLVQLLSSAQAGLTSLPGSIRALLLARVERLSPGAQRLLHAAAVLGTRFSVEALRHVAAVPVAGSADDEAPGLLACEGDECRFTHALVRDAVYDSLLRSTRRLLHQRAALWFESRDPALHAEHLAAAEDPAAAAAHLRAAEFEHRAGRFDRALLQAERGVALAVTDAERCAAHAARGEILVARGRTEDAAAAYRESIALAAAPGPRARATLGLATALRIQDRYDEALEALQAAERHAIDEGDPRRLARVWTLRGNLYFPRGDMEHCLRAHERALELAQEACSVEDIAQALGGLGDAEYQRGRMRSALGRFLRCLELCEQHGLTGLHLVYLPMAAATRNFCGEFTAALAVADQAAVAARRAGDLRTELLGHSVAAATELYRASYTVALQRSERVVAIARQLGTPRFESEGLLIEGLARRGLGDSQAARATLELAVERALQHAPTYSGAWALAALALACDDEARGRTLLGDGERLLAGGSVSHNHLEFHHFAIEFLLNVGDRSGVARQAAALADYTRDEPLPWADVIVARAEALVAAAGSGRRRSAVDRLRQVLGEVDRMGFDALAPRLRAALERRG
jgi:DNA-binding SARP family transcriptional activator/predicted negative regulator of RcsB-dependent stress response